MKKVEKIIILIILIVILVGIVGLFVYSSTTVRKKSDKIQVTVSNFASYDFVRAVVGETDDIEVTYLMGPGKDAHSYEPTAQDIVTIQNSDLFIYIGGTMEAWTEKVLPTIESDDLRVICIADDIETVDEQYVDGAEDNEVEEEHDHDHEHDEGEEHEEHEEHEHNHEHVEGSFDEHIWTSPKNAIIMVEQIEEVLSEIVPENSEIYKENADKYIAEINRVDEQIAEIVNNRKRSRLVFGDKMPFQYFLDYYGLDVSAAFTGCSTETEPSSKTIAYLVDRAKDENIPIILYIELNDGRVAGTIADEVGNGCTAMQIQTLHNVSKQDFENGETWVSLMSRNLEVLEKALL